MKYFILITCVISPFSWAMEQRPEHIVTPRIMVSLTTQKEGSHRLIAPIQKKYQIPATMLDEMSAYSHYPKSADTSIDTNLDNDILEKVVQATWRIYSLFNTYGKGTELIRKLETEESSILQEDNFVDKAQRATLLETAHAIGFTLLEKSLIRLYVKHLRWGEHPRSTPDSSPRLTPPGVTPEGTPRTINEGASPRTAADAAAHHVTPRAKASPRLVRFKEGLTRMSQENERNRIWQSLSEDLSDSPLILQDIAKSYYLWQRDVCEPLTQAKDLPYGFTIHELFTYKKIQPQLPSLIPTLNLSGKRINSLEGIPELTDVSLSNLNLSENLIEKIDPLLINSLRHFKFINIANNPLCSEAIESLRLLIQDGITVIGLPVEAAAH